VTNVCLLSQPVLPDEESAKCKSELKLNVLDGGIMIAMNYFQRTVEGALW
jgi:hypothetical protein